MIYFAENYGMIKIGRSEDPIMRCTQQLGARLLGILEGGFQTEKRLHAKFQRHREHGEWFVDCEEIRRFIWENCPEEFDYLPTVPCVERDDVRDMAEESGRTMAAQIRALLKPLVYDPEEYAKRKMQDAA